MDCITYEVMKSRTQLSDFHILKLYIHSTGTPHSPLSPAPPNLSPTFCLDEFDYFGYLTKVESYNICTFVSGLFHLA